MYGRELTSYEARGRIEKFSAIFCLTILCLTIFMMGLSTYGLFDVDETRYAAASLEMVNSGDYVIPTFNGEPRLNKPILFYWLLAGSSKIFGNDPASYRLVSALSAFFLVMLVGHIVYRESRVEGGFLAGAIMATSPLYAYMGRTTMIDMIFSVFIFLSSLLLYLGIFDGKNVNRILIRGGMVLMGLGFITKGPAGVALPLMSIFVFSWINGRLKRMMEAMVDGPGIVLFFLVILPWYGAVYIRKGGEYFYDFFVKENILRFLHVTSGHRGPVYYYIPIIMLGMFPWAFFLPQAIFSMMRSRGFSLRAMGENISLDMFLFIYSGVIFLFFSLSATKLPTYVLSIVPALAIIIALYFENVIVNRKFPDFGYSIGAYLFATFTLLFGLIIFFPGDYFPIIKKSGLGEVMFIPGILMLTATLLTTLFTLFRSSVKRARLKIFASLLILQILFLWFVFFGILPKVYEYRQADLQNIAEIINSEKESAVSGRIIFYRKFKPSMVFLTGRKVYSASNFEEVVAHTHGAKVAYLIFRGKEGSRVNLSPLGNISVRYSGALYSLYQLYME